MTGIDSSRCLEFGQLSQLDTLRLALPVNEEMEQKGWEAYTNGLREMIQRSFQRRAEVPNLGIEILEQDTEEAILIWQDVFE